MSALDSKMHIAKLGNHNYYAWSYQMEMRLHKLDVWSLVNGSESRPVGSDNAKVVKAWHTCTDLALCKIIGKVEDGQLVHTCVSRDPAAVWSRLEAIHMAQGLGLGSAISTWQKLFRLKKAAETSIQEHVGILCEYTDCLTCLGDTPSDTLLVAILLLSLPPDYSSLVITLDSHKDKNDFNFVVQHYIYKESHQTALQDASVESSSTPNSAYHVNTIKHDWKHITCHMCGQKGHYKNECKSPKKMEVALQSESEDIKW